MITKLSEWIKLNESKIEDKDWDRMSTLLLANDYGEKVAKSIKDKTKAIARFVTGTILAKETPTIRTDFGQPEYKNTFSPFGNKALQLGATAEEIQDAFDTATVPAKFSDKMNNAKGKKLDNRFVGFLSKMILDAGYNIEYTYSGNAITGPGRDAMSRNGRKWTIGYKTIIDKGDKKINFDFDAITDEGDGPTVYVPINTYNPMGKRDFITYVNNLLSK